MTTEEVTELRHVLAARLNEARAILTQTIEEQQTRAADPDVTGKERRHAGSLARQGRETLARIDRQLARLNR